MGLKCGIVGLPNVGKSTLFNALSNAKAQSANFPFCTIEPNLGVINVPDERLDRLAELVNPQKVLPTTIEIYDIAGLVKGASKGEGLGNQFLGNIRECDAVIHMIRCFDDENVVHVDGSVDPVRDKEVIDTELQLKDYETLQKRIEKLKKQAKSNDKDVLKSLELSEQLFKHIEQGKPARTANLPEGSEKYLEDLYLLTSKPIIYVCNVDEAGAVDGNKHVESLKNAVKEEQAEVLVVCAGIEAEIAELSNQEDRLEFLSDLGLKEAGIDRLIRSAYKLLNLITYLTAGEKEVRAWTVSKGSKAPQAAGVIHSDFERGFIRAEVISYSDYSQLGSETACKEAGKMRVEGKEYVVEDGDVMHFRFNV